MQKSLYCLFHEHHKQPKYSSHICKENEVWNQHQEAVFVCDTRYIQTTASRQLCSEYKGENEDAPRGDTLLHEIIV